VSLPEIRAPKNGAGAVEREQSFRAREIAASYLQEVIRLLCQIDIATIERIAQRLRAARDLGATVYLAGNGGSAATASHFANDLGKAAKRSGHAPIRVMSLSDNVPWMTALANDEGYERVFSGQLENFARRGDVLIVISASGKSLNLIRAVEMARERGLVTIGFVGFEGGALMHAVDDCLWLPTSHGAYGPVEDGHAVLCHLLTECLAQADPIRRVDR
jgi:D-sedoheptulose 7-phosphate isomerase